ncbi:MAG: hypothetical protein PHV34_22400 [Verrucomicrobiae bacterium]|nr:hypothetical protein [Verrucomicrobiae bacterium]
MDGIAIARIKPCNHSNESHMINSKIQAQSINKAVSIITLAGIYSFASWAAIPSMGNDKSFPVKNEEILFVDDFKSATISPVWQGPMVCAQLKDGSLVFDFPGILKEAKPWLTSGYLTLMGSEKWINFKIEAKVKVRTPATGVPYIIFGQQRKAYTHYSVSLFKNQLTLSDGWGPKILAGAKVKKDVSAEHYFKIIVLNQNGNVDITCFCDEDEPIHFVDEKDEPYYAGRVGIFAPNCAAEISLFKVTKLAD